MDALEGAGGEPEPEVLGAVLGAKRINRDLRRRNVSQLEEDGVAECPPRTRGRRGTGGRAAFSARAEKAAARLAGVEREARRVVVGRRMFGGGWGVAACPRSDGR